MIQIGCKSCFEAALKKNRPHTMSVKKIGEASVKKNKLFEPPQAGSLYFLGGIELFLVKGMQS